jgi:hypothetical protein
MRYKIKFPGSICPYAGNCFEIYRWIFIIMICILPAHLCSQTPAIPAGTEQQLENNAVNNEEEEIEDDTYIQQLEQYNKHPINLNTANENELQQLHILNAFQLQSLLKYRDLLGKLINIYELQAIPGWSIALIQKLRPFISVTDEVEALTILNKRLRGGEHSILFRASQILERSKGFLIDPAGTANFYRGSPQKLLLRYKYQYKNLLQYGIVGEKDAGEQFFKGKQRPGFDFYSLHFFAKNIGNIKALAVGDFTVSLGQGLIEWQSFAFKKGADVINIKREGAVLKPYNSSGEINFHRGIGMTFGRNKWAITFFLSCKKIDANIVKDSLQNQDEYISSLQTSGYHRTKTEIDDRAVQNQLALGGNFSYQVKKIQFGVNGIWYKFKLPIHKSNEPYNLYALSGTTFGNCSIDYSYTFKNAHLFGEVAFDNNLSHAFVNGLLISVSSTADICFLYRHIAKGYQALYVNAFTENTFPANEAGLYTGLTIHPGTAWRIDAYADLYQFPWLRYRLSAPSAGADYLLQLLYKPNKQVEIYSRFHSESKPVDVAGLSTVAVAIQSKRNWRTQFSADLNRQIAIASRIELLWFNKKASGEEQGFLAYFNFLYKPFSKPWSVGMRLQYFETDGYNSRIYAFENDVMYSFSIPAFYDKGFRYYINTNYDVNKKCGIWIKWEQTIYEDKTLIGSGLDEIKGNKKTAIRIELLYKF